MSVDNLSLMRGGAVHRMLTHAGVMSMRVRIARVIAVMFVAIAFLPVVALAWRDGALLPGSVRMPLLADYGVLSRMLLALPLLILAAPTADNLLRAAIRQFSRGGVVRPNGKERFNAIIDIARRRRDAVLPELICLAIAIVPAGASMWAPELAHLPGWYGDGHGAITDAGRWFAFVSVPLFRFTGLLWLWRFVLWTWMLWKFSRLELDIQPAHPDGAGGLAFLGLAQLRFSAIASAGACVLCGACINEFLYAGHSLNDMKVLLGGYIIGITALLLAPLLLMGSPLLQAKRHALPKFAALGHRALRQFGLRWKKGSTGVEAESLLDSGNASSLADFSSVHANVAAMSIVPITRRHVVTMLLAATVPLVPIVFFTMSLDELASRLASILV